MLQLGAVSALLVVALIAGRCAWSRTSPARQRPRPAMRPAADADAALRRHPAGHRRRTVPAPRASGQPAAHDRLAAGPDDDPEFIVALERLIRGGGDQTQNGLS
jgi:hypothetical protein